MLCLKGNGWAAGLLKRVETISERDSHLQREQELTKGELEQTHGQLEAESL